MRHFISLTLLVAAELATPILAQADSASPVRLELNLAATRLDLFRNDSLIARFPVAIGRPSHPTPVGAFAVRSVEWNPWWIPPPSDWSRGEAPRRPGPGNPMGRVKLNFRPLYFLHGTPDEASIGTASSHGCVRLRNADAIELAVAVMKAGLTATDSAEMTLLAADTTVTSTWVLDRPVPLAIVIRSIEVERDTLYWFPNPYSRPAPPVAQQVFDALRSRSPARVPDSSAVAAFVARATGASKIPVRKLLRGLR